MATNTALEIEDPTVTEHTCDCCDESFQRLGAVVSRAGDLHAIYFASCYHHDGHEAFIDAILSPTWDEDVDDHVTFGCRVGPVAGQPDPTATLVTGAEAFTYQPLFGQRLTRNEALEHPLLTDFWALVDHVLVRDPVVRDHVYGPGAQFATPAE